MSSHRFSCSSFRFRFSVVPVCFIKFIVGNLLTRGEMKRDFEKTV